MLERAIQGKCGQDVLDPLQAALRLTCLPSLLQHLLNVLFHGQGRAQGGLMLTGHSHGTMARMIYMSCSWTSMALHLLEQPPTVFFHDKVEMLKGGAMRRGAKRRAPSAYTGHHLWSQEVGSVLQSGRSCNR